MDSIKLVEMNIDDAERDLISGKPDKAILKLGIARQVLEQRETSAARAGKIGGPIAGITVAELADFLAGGHHPAMDVIFGGLAGFVGGKKVAQFYVDSLSPLWVRIHRGMGKASRMKGDYSEARQHFAAALKASPDDMETRRCFAEVI